MNSYNYYYFNVQKNNILHILIKQHNYKIFEFEYTLYILILLT